MKKNVYFSYNGIYGIIQWRIRKKTEMHNSAVNFSFVNIFSLSAIINPRQSSSYTQFFGEHILYTQKSEIKWKLWKAFEILICSFNKKKKKSVWDVSLKQWIQLIIEFTLLICFALLLYFAVVENVEIKVNLLCRVFEWYIRGSMQSR